jgi:uncharacterized protein (DUF433 family)
MLTIAYPHIEISADGVPMLSGTRIKVIEIALDHLTHHWDAEEIQRQHPHLSLGQIHSALAYYMIIKSRWIASSRNNYAKSRQSKHA